jgi:hypothetical protein
MLWIDCCLRRLATLGPLVALELGRTRQMLYGGTAQVVLPSPAIDVAIRTAPDKGGVLQRYGTPLCYWTTLSATGLVAVSFRSGNLKGTWNKWMVGAL